MDPAVRWQVERCVDLVVEVGALADDAPIEMKWLHHHIIVLVARSLQDIIHSAFCRGSNDAGRDLARVSNVDASLVSRLQL